MLQKTFLKSKNAYKVKFIVKPEQATSVEIFGLNKDWENPIPMVKKKDGTFSVEVA